MTMTSRLALSLVVALLGAGSTAGAMSVSVGEPQLRILHGARGTLVGPVTAELSSGEPIPRFAYGDLTPYVKAQAVPQTLSLTTPSGQREVLKLREWSIRDHKPLERGKRYTVVLSRYSVAPYNLVAQLYEDDALVPPGKGRVLLTSNVHHDLCVAGEPASMAPRDTSRFVTIAVTPGQTVLVKPQRFVPCASRPGSLLTVCYPAMPCGGSDSGRPLAIRVPDNRAVIVVSAPDPETGTTDLLWCDATSASASVRCKTRPL